MRSRKSIDPEVYAVASMFPEANFADANGTRALFSAMPHCTLRLLRAALRPTLELRRWNALFQV